MRVWERLGMVWMYEESAWHRRHLAAKRPLLAPEIHYLKGTFWLRTVCLAGIPDSGGRGLLRSTSGKAQGPYEDVQPSERLGDAIDVSLFQDDDGAVYFLWHSGKIARIKDDMSGLAGPYRLVHTTSADPDTHHHSPLCAKIFGAESYNHIGFEGAYLFKAKGTTTCPTMKDGMAVQLLHRPHKESLRTVRRAIRVRSPRRSQRLLPE